MQPPGRDGGGNRRPFDGIQDPFANFGMGMGMGLGGSRRGMFPDMFENDPFFNDPFFTRPFGSLLGPGGGLFGSNGVFGNNFFRAPLQEPQGGYLEQRPYNSQPDEQRRGPIIVELPDDHDTGDVHVRSRSSQEPIIEHPDDEVKSGDQSSRSSRNVVRQGPLSTSRNGNVRSYSFQSSSVTYGGPKGIHYSSSASRRMGPDGVVEEEFQEKDSATGYETKRHSRGVGEKGRSITRKRTSEGREDSLETLHNLEEEEVPDFERTWEEREKTLPRWGKNRSQAIGSSNGGSGTRSRAALPSSGGWPLNLSGAKRE